MSRKRKLEGQNGGGEAKRANKGDQDGMSESGVRVLAKHLADSSKEKRDKTMGVLSKWLRERETEQKKLDELEMLQVWKGLFYSLWMSDKVAVQQELADKIAALMGNFRRSSNAVLFFRCFFIIMLREWPGLDKIRLDKFLSLIRKVVYQSLLFAKDKGKFESICTVIRDQVLMKKPLGLAYHICDVYFDEISRSGCNELESSEQLDELLSPFYCLLGDNHCAEPLFDHVMKRIFDPLVLAETNPFHHLDLARVANAMFDIAADAQGVAKRRKTLYDFVKVAKKAAKASSADDSVQTPTNSKSQDEEDDDEQQDEDEAMPATPELSRNLGKAFDTVGDSSSPSNVLQNGSTEKKKAKGKKAKEEKKKTKKRKSSDSDALKQDSVGSPLPEKMEESNGDDSSKKRNKKKKGAAAEESTKKTKSSTSAKKRLRWSKETVQVSHEISMKRTRTTPIKPAAKVSSPQTSAIKDRALTPLAGPRPTRSLKKEITLARQNAKKNADIPMPGTDSSKKKKSKSKKR